VSLAGRPGTRGPDGARSAADPGVNRHALARHRDLLCDCHGYAGRAGPAPPLRGKHARHSRALDGRVREHEALARCADLASTSRAAAAPPAVGRPVSDTIGPRRSRRRARRGSRRRRRPGRRCRSTRHGVTAASWPLRGEFGSAGAGADSPLSRLQLARSRLAPGALDWLDRAPSPP
jgi:hypothetical protein